MKSAKSLIVLLVAVPLLFGQDSTEVNTEITTDVKTVVKAPTFFLRTLDGDSFFLSRHVGENARPNMKQPVVMSFFATWCIPCKAEIPILHVLQEKYPGIKFVLVNVEEQSDLITKYVEQNQISLPVLLDKYSVVAKKYNVVNEKNVAVLPQLKVIDTQGNLVYDHTGYESGDEDSLEATLVELINQPANIGVTTGLEPDNQ